MAVIDEVAKRISDWQGKQISIAPLSGGLTNSNFKIEVDGTPYFVRVPGASTDLLAIDRANEHHNTKAASEAGVAPKIFYHLPEYNVMVIEFLNGKTMSKDSLNELGQPTRMAQAIKEIPLFHGMNSEQAGRLAGVCTVREIGDKERLFAQHDPADRLYLVLQGRVAIKGGSPPAPIGTVRAGETCVEVSLLSARPHSATATAEGPVEAAELLQRDLADLIRRRPDIGVIIYRNLAIGLGDKLARSVVWTRDQRL